MRAHSILYEMSSVIGVEFRVQAVVASQRVTAEVLLEAFNPIEQYDYTEFAFVCQEANHCSVACCFLLAAIAYPGAIVCLSTPKALLAADEHRLVRPSDH